MGSLSWASRFGLSDRELSELQNHLSASGEDPLRWVLVNGHLDEREYLQWAMNTYELPIVKNEFFKIPADLPFWEAVRTGFNWTPGFVPLAEWNGVLLIGCLEPPRFHFPLRSAHRFVLASAKQLEARFYQYNPQLAPATQDEVSNSSSNVEDTGSYDLVSEAATPVPVQQEVRQRPMDEYLADSLPPAPDVSLENPDGLVHEVAPASTPNLFVVPDGMSTDDIGQPLSPLPDGIADGTAIMDFSALNENSEFDQPKVAQTATAQAQTVQPQVAPPVQFAKPTAPPVVKPAPVELAARPYDGLADTAPAIPIPTPDVIAASIAAQPVAQASAPKAVSNVTPIGTAQASVVANTAQAIPLETCPTYDALGTAAIGHMLKHFDQGLVLMFQGGELKPWKWTEQLLSVKGDSPDAIPLEQASIFRIAYRTCLPYHGYVVPNAVNTAFFNAFNRGIVPKHVTLVPVMIAGDLVGMLMGIALEKVDYKESLMAMEKLASEFGTNLDRMRSRQAA